MSLQDELADDLDAFFDTDEFATTATIAGASVDCIYDRPYGEAEEMAGYRPSIYCKSADAAVAAVKEGDAVTVDGAAFLVAGIETDGTGVMRLVLQEAT